MFRKFSTPTKAASSPQPDGLESCWIRALKSAWTDVGRWMDNVFIERLWRSVKYEETYLFEHATGHALRDGLAKWFGRYNTWRPHEALGKLTPAVVYQTGQQSKKNRKRHDLPPGGRIWAASAPALNLNQ
jgi:hypothetical protein